jgi:hypothetical protein
MEQSRLQSAESVSVERRLRRLKIIPLAHSSDRANVLAHSSDQTHVNVGVHSARLGRSTGVCFASATAPKAKSNAVAVKALIIGLASVLCARGNRRKSVLFRAAHHMSVNLSLTKAVALTELKSAMALGQDFVMREDRKFANV